MGAATASAIGRDTNGGAVSRFCPVAQEEGTASLPAYKARHVAKPGEVLMQQAEPIIIGLRNMPGMK
jgi:hypothetical protein